MTKTAATDMDSTTGTADQPYADSTYASLRYQLRVMECELRNAGIALPKMNRGSRNKTAAYLEELERILLRERPLRAAHVL